MARVKLVEPAAAHPAAKPNPDRIAGAFGGPGDGKIGTQPGTGAAHGRLRR